jgi:excisionase family DNA binding protein
MAMTESKFARRGTFRPASDADSRAQRNRARPDAESLAERLSYSVTEAALITGLSRDLLYDQMRTGKLAYLKVGRRRIITRRSLETFLARPAS